MTRRISSSRPTTGSSLPARASAVRSRPYFSSAAYVLSGFWRRDALAAADALQRLEDGLLAGGVALEQRLGLAAGLGDAEEQVLGRDVLVAEAAGLGLGALDDALARGSRVSEPPWIRARLASAAASSPRNAGQVDAEPPERLGRDAVVGLDERAEQVLGVEDRALEPLGGLLGGDDGLLGLLGESVELHGQVSLGCGGRVGRRGR